MLELLLVIGIIIILAALLLPAIQRGLDKGRQTQCLSNLRQIGIGFQSWAHDHGDRFPMQVPYRDGGSLEANRQLLRGFPDLSFSPRHFQVLSNELSTPKIVVCPADKKTAARSFGQLGNTNFSYWVNTKAALGNSIQMLSGDWNVTSFRIETNSGPVPQIRLQFDNTLHQNLGDVLFADVHVELIRTLGTAATPNGASGPGGSSGTTPTGGGGANSSSGPTGGQTQDSSNNPSLSPQPALSTSVPNGTPPVQSASQTPSSESTNRFQTNQLTRSNSNLDRISVPAPAARRVLGSPEAPAEKSPTVVSIDIPKKASESEPAEEEEAPLTQLMKEMSKWMLILLLILITILLTHRYLTRRKKSSAPTSS